MISKERSNLLIFFTVFVILTLLPQSGQYIISSQSPNYKDIDTRSLPECDYRFFVAGHVYGTPGLETNGLYSPFKLYFDELKSLSNMEFGILTGDIVRTSNTESWDKVDQDLEILDMEVYFAPGNHDMTDPDLYASRYGEFYYSFIHENDLFIILNPNLNSWNISGDQFQFLETTLFESASTSNNIFVFFHQLIWIDTSTNLSYVDPNSLDDKSETTNFWSKIMPLFLELENEVYLFSGDVGAIRDRPSFFLEEYQGVTFVASGMGSGEGDNFLIVSVSNDSRIVISKIDIVPEYNILLSSEATLFLTLFTVGMVISLLGIGIPLLYKGIGEKQKFGFCLILTGIAVSYVWYYQTYITGFWVEVGMTNSMLAIIGLFVGFFIGIIVSLSTILGFWEYFLK